ncbi:MAG: hypothetical protein KGD63_11525 [Candidatus Lokiarchaeota archaeon]|nr:hypothetical protein [Candidatus Lokiarchaeota archaeon]
MKYNWKELAIRVGSLEYDSSGNKKHEYGGTSFARDALELILGKDEIKEMVDYILDYKEAENLVLSILSYIKSSTATEYAYNIFKNSDGQRAMDAVWIIKHIAHPMSFKWIEEFLDNENVKGWGIGVLDQLLWESLIDEEDAEYLLKKGENDKDKNIRDNVEFIRNYLNRRK